VLFIFDGETLIKLVTIDFTRYRVCLDQRQHVVGSANSFATWLSRVETRRPTTNMLCSSFIRDLSKQGQPEVCDLSRMTCSKYKATTQVVHLAARTGSLYATAVTQQYLLMINPGDNAGKIVTECASTTTYRFVKRQTEPAITHTPRTRSAETNMDEVLSRNLRTTSPRISI